MESKKKLAASCRDPAAHTIENGVALPDRSWSADSLFATTLHTHANCYELALLRSCFNVKTTTSTYFDYQFMGEGDKIYEIRTVQTSVLLLRTSSTTVGIKHEGSSSSDSWSSSSPEEEALKLGA